MANVPTDQNIGYDKVIEGIEYLIRDIYSMQLPEEKAAYLINSLESIKDICKYNLVDNKEANDYHPLSF